MPIFQYKARDKAGNLTEGTMTAETEAAVVAKLEQMGCLPITLTKSKTDAPGSSLFDKFRPVKLTDINMFTRQLFALQKAGLPLLASLNALAAQITSRKLKDAIQQTSRDIESGTNFSSALQRHPHIFNELYVNMIRAGEVSGRLPEILRRLYILGEHDQLIRMRVKAAVRYPIMVVLSMVIGFTVLVTWIVPKFQDLYDKFDSALPLPTQILLGINVLARHYWWVVLILIVGSAFAVRKYISTEKGLYTWDLYRLKMPIFGPLIVKLIMSRFCRLTGTLMQSGVPILQILDLVSDSVGNLVISKTIDDIKTSVNEGKGMLPPMKESHLFPAVVTQMVAIGEETAKIDELFLHISDYYDSEIDHTIKNLVSLIEPMLIFVLGIGVLFMALGIFMPMWSMMSLFK